MNNTIKEIWDNNPSKLAAILFFGFSAGLPILLIFSSLSIWLREAGVDRSMVTYFSWAALGYSFKFIWAPIIDKMPLPGLTQWLGRRRAWLLTSQIAIIIAIIWMAMTDPAITLMPMALAAVMLGFSSATQDIVIDAYRIESADPKWQTLMASTYIAGYRIGMVAAGAGTLKIAAWYGGDATYDYYAWRYAYFCMAGLMGIGVITTLIINEPKNQTQASQYLNSVNHYLRFLLLFLITVSAFIATYTVLSPQILAIKMLLIIHFNFNKTLAGFFMGSHHLLLSIAIALLIAKLSIHLKIAHKQILHETYFAPLLDFFTRYGKLALLILALISLYRISDIVLGIISNVFYQDMGYSKDQIADITKTFGLLMTILGGFLGGGLALRFGVMRILFLGALLSALTNLLFMWLALMLEPNAMKLIIVITADNLSAGIAGAAFVAYLSGLTNISFTAFQYALFSSIMTLIPKTLGGYSGSIVDSVGYPSFFLMTTIIGIPVLILIVLATHFLDIKEPSAKV